MENIFTKFGITKYVVTDNGTQFTNKFWEFIADFKIWHHFTSVEHPQVNGQAKATNYAIL